jgi:hypothetical protein
MKSTVPLPRKSSCSSRVMARHCSGSEFDMNSGRLYTPQTLMNTNFAHAPHHQHHHHVM